MKCLCLLLVILVLYWCYNNNNIVEGQDNLSCICTLTGSKDLQNCKCTVGCYDNILFKKYDNKGLVAKKGECNIKRTESV